jgi:hypothetical protein
MNGFDFGVQRHQLIGEGDALHLAEKLFDSGNRLGNFFHAGDRHGGNFSGALHPFEQRADGAPGGFDGAFHGRGLAEGCPSSKVALSATASRARAAIPVKLPQTPTTASSTWRLVSCNCLRITARTSRHSRMSGRRNIFRITPANRFEAISCVLPRIP